MNNLEIENENLKKQIKLYIISTQLDYDKIQKLKDEILELKELIIKN